MDTHFLSTTGKVNIEFPLEPDCNYQYTGEISTYGKSITSNQDGTHNVTHKAKFIGSISLIKGDKVILGKKNSSHSQVLRKQLHVLGIDYEPFMTYLSANLDDAILAYESSQRSLEETEI